MSTVLIVQILPDVAVVGFAAAVAVAAAAVEAKGVQCGQLLS